MTTCNDSVDSHATTHRRDQFRRVVTNAVLEHSDNVADCVWRRRKITTNHDARPTSLDTTREGMTLDDSESENAHTSRGVPAMYGGTREPHPDDKRCIRDQISRPYHRPRCRFKPQIPKRQTDKHLSPSPSCKRISQAPPHMGEWNTKSTEPMGNKRSLKFAATQLTKGYCGSWQA